VVDGTMNATSVVPPYNETAVYDARVTVGTVVTKFNYALELLTELPALRLRTQAEVRRIRKVEVPAAGVSVAALLPQVSSGGSVKTAAIAFDFAAHAPVWRGGKSVKPSAVDLAFSAPTPVVISGASVSPLAVAIETLSLAPVSVGTANAIQIPAATIATASTTPAIVSGASISIPVANTAIAALIPAGINFEPDPDFSNVSLLLHMDGADGSTTFTDSSSYAHTVTATGASITTAISKFGGASGWFYGLASWYVSATDPSLNLGGKTASWTVECWIYVTTEATGTVRGIWQNGDLTTATHKWRANIQYSGTSFKVIAEGINSQEFAEYYAAGSSFNLSRQTWYHVAVTLDGSTLRIFVDGVLHGSGAAQNLAGTLSPTDEFHVGRNRISTVNRYFLGYIDDVRVTKGVCRYTSAFTPPTAAFPNG
jgi:hypothetical protein